MTLLVKVELGVADEPVADGGPAGFARGEAGLRRALLGVAQGGLLVEREERRLAARGREARGVAEEGPVQDVEAVREGRGRDLSRGRIEGEDDAIPRERRRLAPQIALDRAVAERHA